MSIVECSVIVCIVVLKVFSFTLSAICVILFRLLSSCASKIFCMSVGKKFSQTTFKNSSVTVFPARLRKYRKCWVGVLSPISCSSNFWIFWCFDVDILLMCSFLMVLYLLSCGGCVIISSIYILSKFHVELWSHIPVFCCVLDDFIQLKLTLKLTEP